MVQTLTCHELCAHSSNTVRGEGRRRQRHRVSLLKEVAGGRGGGERQRVKAALCAYGSASSKRKKKSKHKHTLTHRERRRPTAQCLVLRVSHVLQCVVVCCSVLQCVQCGTAVCCSVLQCVAVC